MGETTPTQSVPSTPKDDSNSRSRIGAILIISSLAIITLFAALPLLFAVVAFHYCTEKCDTTILFDNAKETLTILLPVISTWVGTVLAFYFSRENFSAAAKHTENLLSQIKPNEKLERIAAIDVMIPMDSSSTIKFNLDKPEGDIKLKPDLIESYFDKYGKNRLPILNKDGHVLYLIHRSMVDKFIAGQALAGNAAVADLTLKDLLADTLLKKLFTAFGTINKTDKLIAAKNKMDGNPDCSDVFVTENGTATSKALGWITNVTVEENSTL